jgi:hypothetical protein
MKWNITPFSKHKALTIEVINLQTLYIFPMKISVGSHTETKTESTRNLESIIFLYETHFLYYPYSIILQIYPMFKIPDSLFISLLIFHMYTPPQYHTDFFLSSTTEDHPFHFHFYISFVTTLVQVHLFSVLL